MIINSSSALTGSVYNVYSDIQAYLSLKSENKILLEENRLLKEELLNINFKKNNIVNEKKQALNFLTYKVLSARLIKNSFKNYRNYLTINKGKFSGIRQDMAVINHKGVIGIVERTSENFSVIQSILNRDSAINAKVKGTNSFGTIIWENDLDYQYVTLNDIPKVIEVKEKDTIITAGMSHIFPKGIEIGVIDEVRIRGNYNVLKVKLFNDMTKIDNVYLIDYKYSSELEELEKAFIYD